MTNFRVEAWNDEVVPQLLELAQTTLGAGGAVAKTEAFWRWKHSDNPFGRSYGIYALDEATDRIAALRILLSWKFVSNGNVCLHAARAVDTATHPSYQRQGLFSRLTMQAVSDLREEGSDLIFNTPNEKSLPGYLKMGWKLVDKRALYLRTLRPARMVGRRLRPVDEAVAGDPQAYFVDGQVMSWHRFIDEHGTQAWDLLREWESKRVLCGWRTERSEAYYAWRYGKHPNVTYYVYVTWQPESKRGDLAGVAILRPNVRFGWQEVVLCDLILSEPSPADGRNVVRSLLRHLRADYVVAHFAPASIEYASIRKSGFLRVPRHGMHFTVRPLIGDFDDISQPGAWDLSLGDLEVF